MSNDTLISGIVIVGYILLIYYYVYATISIQNSNVDTDVKTTFILINSLFTFFLICIFAFKLYTYYYLNNKDTNILGADHFIYILAIFIYLTLIYGSFTNIGFRTFFVILLVLIGFGIFPFVIKVIYTQILPFFPWLSTFFGTPTESGNYFKDSLYPFYTSPYFIVIAIMIGLSIILTTATKFNIPNIGTWQLWATIATIIFGIKYLLLYRFSYSNIFIILGLLSVISLLTFLMIQTTPISQSTLTFLFSIACILFSIMLPIPTDIPYLSFGFFISALALTLSLGLFTQRINFSTIKILFSICALYMVIHFSNELSTNKNVDYSGISPLKPYTAPILYLLSWAIITTLYFIDLDSTNNNLNATTIGIGVFVGVISTIILGVLTSKAALPESSSIGILVTLIGILLMAYYLLSSTYSVHINYSIVFLILMFMFFSFGFMIYNLKNIAGVILFFFVVLLPIIFISLFKQSFVGASKSSSGGPFLQMKESGMVIGGVVLVIAWIFISVFFWSSSGLTFDKILDMNSLSITSAGFLVYLIFYYAYVTFTSKVSVSQKFSQIIFIIMCVYLLLQIFKKTKISTNPFISFAINCIEYIPCLYDNAVSTIMNMKRDDALKEDFTYHSGGTMILSGVVVCVVLYYLYPTLSKWFSETTHTSGITLVGDTPLSTNESHMIKTYEDLTKDPEKPLYNYGISFSLYIGPSSGNDTFYKVVDFSGNLFVKYNTAQNQLYIYALKDSGSEEPPEVVLYRYNQFPLQKWVKIEINYVGGVYDIFVDNKIKNSNKLVSYNSHSNIFVGEIGSSVVGKVKNFIYYDKPLSIYQIKNTK
jgi:hypothetical protein